MVAKSNDFWNQRLSIIPGVSDRYEKALALLDIDCLWDLLWHIPIAYQNRSLRTISYAKSRLNQEEAQLIRGTIIAKQFIKSSRHYWKIVLTDQSSQIDILFFNLPFYLQNKLKKNQALECFGMIRFVGSSVAMLHPKWRIIDTYQLTQSTKVSHYSPIYSLKKPLNQTLMQKLIEFCLAKLNVQSLIHPLDKIFSDLPSLNQSLIFLHKPPINLNLEKLHQALEIKKLVVYELTNYLLSANLVKFTRNQFRAPDFALNKKTQILIEKLKASLAFKLTEDQENSIKEIHQDLSCNTPMQRLLQGDVACGKTIVCAFSAIPVLSKAYQVALMAPTEVLANQHYDNFQKWFNPLGFAVFYLSSAISKKEQKIVLQKIKENKALILIGTHALFQKHIEFKSLALVIIDEPQRFGVIQRLKLLEKAEKTHQLLVSATPIPRTLAQSIYADLSLSQIRQKPNKIEPIQTVIFNRTNFANLIARIKVVLDQGDQVYWVCPSIDSQEQTHLIKATEVFAQLSQKLNHKVELIHGRLKSEIKHKIISDFKQKKIALLVATTVIEVGIDCPNASVMVIENANYLGLASLHQLRGRVGRGDKKGYCVLVYQNYLSKNQWARLEKLKSTSDGFEIAHFDLQTRGAGDLFGVSQKGTKLWDFLRLPQDQIWIEKVQQKCEQWIKKDKMSALNYLKENNKLTALDIYQVK